MQRDGSGELLSWFDSMTSHFYKSAPMKGVFL
uniref:Uncharacterized protein n=1 Tax=virus sp. ctmTa7 TaxID=2828255 RepID=A0A8S5RBX1_9VIRU|nr:MAG TPA: hypothetical protein [virus sp. ctmTa7]